MGLVAGVVVVVREVSTTVKEVSVVVVVDARVTVLVSVICFEG